MLENQPSSDPTKEIATRVDAAHVPFSAKGRTEREPLDELLSAIAGKNEEVSVAQLRGQSMELAGHLQQQQQQLDQREADFNARMAEVENEMRAARLKVTDRERHTLTHDRNQGARSDSTFANDESRESFGVGLYDQVESLTNQTASQAPTESPSHTGRSVSDNESLSLHSETTERWKSGLSVYNEIPEIVGSEDVDDEREFDAQSQQFVADDCELDPATTAHQSDWLTARRRARNEAAQAEAEFAPSLDHRETEASERGSEGTVIDADSLDRRKEELDQRQSAVEELYDEMTQLHRESLELRLVTEQMWGQLTQTTEPVELGRSLAELREKLSDHYQMVNHTLDERKTELFRLQRKLKSQHNKLRERRREAQMWLERNQQGLESKELRLLDREQEIDRQEAELRRQSEVWRREREEYRSEVETLTKRLTAS